MLTVMPIVAIILSALGAIGASFFIYISGDFSWKVAMLSFPTMLLVMTLLMSSKYLRSTKQPRMNKAAAPSKTAYNMVVGVIVISLILSFIFTPIAFFVPGSIMKEELTTDEAPMNYLPGSFFNGSNNYSISENVRVLKGENLTLKDAVIEIKGTSSAPIYFWVDKGGSITADNVTFRVVDGKRAMSWELHGESSFNDCSFDGIWGDLYDQNGQGGIEIYQDSLFTGCSFNNGSSNLMMIVECKVVIDSCSFSNTEDDAIEVRSGELELRRSEIRNVGWGVCTFDGSDILVDACLFTDVQEGIALSWSTGKVTDTEFRNVTREALSVPFGATLEEEDLIFDNVADERSSESGFESVILGTCTIIPFAIGILALIVVIIIRKKAIPSSDKL